MTLAYEYYNKENKKVLGRNSKQTNWLWFDGKQMKLSDFLELQYEDKLVEFDQDDDSNSWEATYTLNGIVMNKEE